MARQSHHIKVALPLCLQGRPYEHRLPFELDSILESVRTHLFLGQTTTATMVNMVVGETVILVIVVDAVVGLDEEAIIVARLGSPGAGTRDVLLSPEARASR